MAQPEKKFRCGGCEVAVFENEIETRDGKKVRVKRASFQKRYRSPEGEWKSTSSLEANDIPKARLALNEAYKYIVMSRAADESGDAIST